MINKIIRKAFLWLEILGTPNMVEWGPELDGDMWGFKKKTYVSNSSSSYLNSSLGETYTSHLSLPRMR